MKIGTLHEYQDGELHLLRCLNMLGYAPHNKANLRNCREQFIQFIPKIAVSLQVVIEIKGINFGKQVKDMRNILHE